MIEIWVLEQGGTFDAEATGEFCVERHDVLAMEDDRERSRRASSKMEWMNEVSSRSWSSCIAIKKMPRSARRRNAVVLTRLLYPFLD